MEKKILFGLIAVLVVVGTLQAEPPCWVEQEKLLASDGAAGDRLGVSASISGDYTIVGAPYDNVNGPLSGSAYIFKKSATPVDPNWYQVVKLTPSDAAAGDYFGNCVSVNGNYAIVGARHSNANGAAYIFTPNEVDHNKWDQQAKLTASDGETFDLFGHSVSVSDDYAIVGAYADDDNGSVSGSAYIFRKSDILGDPNWYQQCKLTASDGAAGDHFGCSVSIKGDYAIVEAHHDDDKGSSSGSAYIFKKSDILGDPNWYQQCKLTASDGAAGDYFGHSAVSVSGSYAIVGAFGDDDKGDDSGSAYIFKRSETPSDPNWYEQVKLSASDGAPGDYFGISASIDGDYAIVGASYDNANGSLSGSAYIFKRSEIPGDPNWYEQQKLAASDGTDGDDFGISVSVSSDYAIIGARNNDANGLVDSGSAYVFENVCAYPIERILDFIEDSVEAGTLSGSGPGRSAQGRLGALINMIEAAGNLIDAELIADACWQLQDAYNRTDGNSPPPDFVAGPAAAELASKIEVLRTTLGCE